jgi:hypothetical protein
MPASPGQHGEQHRAVEQHGDHAGGDCRTVAAQQPEGQQQQHQCMGQPAGTQVMAARRAQPPGTDTATDPQQRQGAQAGARVHAAGQGAQDQQGGGIGRQVLERAVQQRCAEYSEQPGQALRGHCPCPPVQLLLGGKTGQQQRHEGEAGIEGAP